MRRKILSLFWHSGLGHSGISRRRFGDRDATHPAELVAFAIAVSADAADGRRGIGNEFLRHVIHGLFHVCFRG